MSKQDPFSDEAFEKRVQNLKRQNEPQKSEASELSAIRASVYTKIASVAKEDTTIHLISDMTDSVMARVETYARQREAEARISELERLESEMLSSDSQWYAIGERIEQLKADKEKP